MYILYHYSVYKVTFVSYQEAAQYAANNGMVSQIDIQKI